MAKCPSDGSGSFRQWNPVQTIRHLLAKRHYAALICTVALLLKLLVPTGYMIAGDHGRVAITICSGMTSTAMAIDMPGMHDDAADHRTSKESGKAEMPCGFASLSAAIIGPIDPAQLAALFAFILAAGIVSTRTPAPSPPAFLRPPLRGPPHSL